ncbi:Metalloendopeptidase [Aphelenchoides besseyi]|nr:Metalloendopeptidase [Aphelenchoides besseyi]KAI6202367.1 Metalloendopeptidase [Aphelenchoides besseyi]
MPFNGATNRPHSGRNGEPSTHLSSQLIGMIMISLFFCILPSTSAQLTSLFHELPEQISLKMKALEAVDGSTEGSQSDSEVAEIEGDKAAQLELSRSEPMWLKSGKFQGDIDGVDPEMLRKLNSAEIQLNALKNKQLIWTNGIIPYILDEAFTQSEVRLLEKAFRTYRKRTCIRFRPHTNEKDYLYVVKGLGCYSQVGKTGGKQEISLGRGCLYHEIVLHELMHSVGAWHEHSRADRDEHVKIRWENILNGMESQFDIISPALQDTQGIPYDYRSIMHYDSAAFSRNGKNTIEAMEDGFTNIIGAAKDLSELDVVKLNKLYECPARPQPSDRRRGVYAKKGLFPTIATTNPANKRLVAGTVSSAASPISGTTVVDLTASTKPGFGQKTIGTSNTKPPRRTKIIENICQDHFLDCPGFKEYCRKVSFFFVMKAYCPQTCGHCRRT